MKHKTNELSGKALDYAVALAQGYKILSDGINHAIVLPDSVTKIIGQSFTVESIALDLINQYNLTVIRANDVYDDKTKTYNPSWFCQGTKQWVGHNIMTSVEGENFQPCFMIDQEDGIYGTTPAQAIGRMVVLMLLGNSVEIPDELN